MQGSDYGGRILLGDNTDRGTVMLRPIRFQGVRVWISTGLIFIYMFIQLTIRMHKSDWCKIRPMADNLERNYHVSRGVSVVWQYPEPLESIPCHPIVLALSIRLPVHYSLSSKISSYVICNSEALVISWQFEWLLCSLSRILFHELDFSRFRWPRGLSHRCATVLLLGLQVPIPTWAWMSVFCKWCVSCR